MFNTMASPSQHRSRYRPSSFCWRSGFFAVRSSDPSAPVFWSGGAVAERGVLHTKLPRLLLLLSTLGACRSGNAGQSANANTGAAAIGLNGTCMQNASSPEQAWFTLVPCCTSC